jgi:hypothetical protein
MPRAYSSVLRAARVQRLGQLAAIRRRSRAGRGTRRGDEPREVARQAADRRRDRHVVVVEDHHQAVAAASALFIAS